MGLDMYLNARRYMSEYGPEKEAKEQIDAVDFGQGDMRVQYVEVKAAYWRKANAIHRWFVEHVQGGEDDCKSYGVSVEKLQQLKEVCDQVLGLTSLLDAESVLPTRAGFFFGSTDYDDGYREDMEYTSKRLGELLAMPNLIYWDFSYRASW